MQAATKGGGTAVSSLDNCKIQAGTAVVISPLTNTAQLSAAAPVSAKVLISGANALNLASSVEQSVTGPVPNMIGGLISNTLNGACEFTCGSMKVNIEGQPALRLNDPTTQNNSNCVGSIASPSQAKVIIKG